MSDPRNPEIRHIDSNITDAYMDLSPDFSARALISAVDAMSWYIYGSDKVPEQQKGSRLTSWVEPDDITNGYALMLGRPQVVDPADYHNDYRVHARFFRIDALNQIAKPRPLIEVCPNDLNNPESIARIQEILEPRDVVASLFMIAKIQRDIIFNNPQRRTNVDPLVAVAILADSDNMDQVIADKSAELG